ncbi:hypothetical protein [Leisingera sp. M523]|uniref:hypothetical protein n=1 Tax=Leisingera sp. M523 TaxID=2867013 RepID=UPI0021A52462|nr:hypothetical protein [Leisingera sp. M523]
MLEVFFGKVNQPVPDHVVQGVEALLGRVYFGVTSCQPLRLIHFGFLLACAQWAEKCVRLLGGKQIFSNMLKNQFVKSAHRYTMPSAPGFP